MSKLNKKVVLPFLLVAVVVLIGSFSFLLSVKLEPINTKNMVGAVRKVKFNGVSDNFYIEKLVSTSYGKVSIQGISYLDGKVYFSISNSGKGKKNYDPKIQVLYDNYSKKASVDSNLDKALTNYEGYKVNDMTTKTQDFKNGRNYYIHFKAQHGSAIVFNENGVIRNSKLKRNENKKETSLATIAYNKLNKKFYSTSKSAIYKIDIPIIDKNNINPNVGDSYAKQLCKIKNKAVNYTLQGITMNGYLLYQTYNTHPGDKNNYKNYVDIYYTRDCKKGVTLEPIQTLNLGKCSAGDGSNNCEIESIAYAEGKFYLAYNNSTFDGINIYSLKVNNNDINSTVKVVRGNNESISLIGTAESKENKLLHYKFCKNKNGDGCKKKRFKKDGKDKIANKQTITEIINDTNSDWYFIAYDIFGNSTTSKVSKSSINKLLK